MTQDLLKTALEKEWAALVKYIRGIVRNSGVADDLTQETMLRAYLDISELRDHARFIPWLYRIATNVCRDYFRKQKRTNKQVYDGSDAIIAPQDLRDENAPQLDKVIECAEMGECVRQYFDKLPNSYRVVIILHDLEEMTNPEIADILCISIHATKVRLHRARRRLRIILENVCNFYTDERGILVCEPKKDKSSKHYQVPTRMKTKLQIKAMLKE
ncbi:MAG: RNA polymerase sigma factor [Proteobacteria bacterium]|nr:RNA polymerase sigma factor [Pseudomonadota bacterium]